MNLTLDQLNKLKAKHKKATFKIKLSPQYSDSMATPRPSQRFENLLYFPKDPDINNTVSRFLQSFKFHTKDRLLISITDIAWYRRIISAYESRSQRKKKMGFILMEKNESLHN